jgi:hypothetical protein
VIKSRTVGWVGLVTRVGEKNVYKILVGQPEGERQNRRPRCGWEDNIKMCLREIGRGSRGLDSSDGDQWRAVVNTVMNLWFP